MRPLPLRTARLAVLAALVLAACGPTLHDRVAALPLDAAPPPPPAPPLDFPGATTATLENGLRLVMLPMHASPTVSIRLEMLGGDRSEPAELVGLASFTAEAMKLGTPTRDAAKIAEDIDFLGSTVGFGCESDACYAEVEALTKNLAPTLALVAELLTTPTFPEDELANLRGQFLAWLAYQESQPEFPGQRLLRRLLFPDHAYGRYAPTAESLTAITRDAVVRFHAERIAPSHAVLVVAGDVDPDAFEALAREVFGGWKADGAPSVPRDLPAPVTPQRVIHLVDRPGAVQATVLVGHRALPRAAPGYLASRAADEILGGGAARRLFRDLREARGLTYGAGTALEAWLDGGMTYASADVRNEKVAEALVAALSQITTLATEPPPAAELGETTRYLAGALALRLDSPTAVATLVARQRTYDLPEDEWSGWPARLAALTPDDVHAAARALWSADGLVVVIVGDATSLAPTLAPILPLSRYDATGRPVP